MATEIKSILIVAAASEKVVEQCLAELKDEIDYKKSITLLSTKGYRFEFIDSYLDLACKMLSEGIRVELDYFSEIIVIQHSRTIIPNLNIYKWLQSNQVTNFKIKTKAHDCIDTSVSKMIGNIEDFRGYNEGKVFWINPEDIQYCAGIDTLHFGQVVDGDWDLELKHFERELPIYESLKLRLEQRVDWSNTPYYKDILSSIYKSEVRFGCKTEADLIRRCQYLDTLLESIKEQGWIQLPDSDYITVNIGRHGELLFADGRHRLAIAKILKLKKIPVKIAIRHALWVAFKNEVLGYAKEHQSGQLYAPIEHIDFQGFDYLHKSDRFNLIAEQIRRQDASVLDIGSHWGRACAELEKKGHRCVAVEANVSNFYFLDRIKKAENREFKAHCDSIFNFISVKKHFDVVLALNIFHHFLKTNELYLKLKSLLELLDMEQLFLQTHSPSELQMKGAYINFSGEEFCHFIINHTGLTEYRLLDLDPSGRALYMLTK